MAYFLCILADVPTSQLVDTTEEQIATIAAAPPGLDSFISTDSMTIAEVIWCLKVVSSRFSYRSCSDLPFAQMFPDSRIAQKFSMGYNKMSYVIAFGLAPHFSNHLMQLVKKCDSFTVHFDEAFNRISQKSQMDIHLRFCLNGSVLSA